MMFVLVVLVLVGAMAEVLVAVHLIRVVLILVGGCSHIGRLTQRLLTSNLFQND